MSDSHETPSSINGSTVKHTPDNGNYFYITALLRQDDLVYDPPNGVEADETVSNAGPMDFDSPLQVGSFTPSSVGQIAYFQEGPIGAQYL
jgi:hypothetical protein